MKHKHILISVICYSLLFILAACSPNESTSSAWNPKVLEDPLKSEIFIPDFSYAGYRWGEEPIPALTGNELDARDFGVTPDDKKDDTQALKRLFKAAHAVEGPVVVRLPAGKIILTDILYIERSNFRLVGAGSDPEKGTILYMPQALSEIPTPAYFKELSEYLIENEKRQRERDRGVDEPFSLYSWSGGFIWSNYPGERGKPYLERYNTPQSVLATISGGQRGEHSFTVTDASQIEPGMIIRVNWYNKEGENSSLLRYLYDEQEVTIGKRHWESPETPLTKQEVTVLRIEDETVHIKEPLLHDLRPEWYPDVTAWGHITDIGIEGIQFEFLYQEYRYHHVEYGFNAIYLTNTSHSWVRDISFKNGDNGILTDLCSNVTIEDVKVFGRKYHYGVHFGDCYNMLARDLYIQAPIVHALTFNTGSRSCVYTDCLVLRDPTLDQHSGLNYQNLFDNSRILIDDPEHRPLTMGGAKYWWPSHAAFSTLWNIEIEYLFPHSPADTIRIKGVTDSPSARLVGIHANYPISIDYPINTYQEGTNRANMAIPSLYEYQLSQRLGSK